MTVSVLITQCLQHDFVAPIGPHEPLPNLLHVGAAEATRLLGPDPAAGPLAQLMQWARGSAGDDLAIVHVRDWHDGADPAQRDHLETFGTHCLAGSDGARLVLGLDEGLGPYEHLVDALTLNDFADARIESVVRAVAGGRPLRVGVVGVWTEAKVTFLLYELKTRLGIDELATCSALTASASRAQHFNALDQLQKLLGVEVCDSVAEFADWLAPGARLEIPKSTRGYAPVIEGLEPDADHAASDRAIVSHLFRNSARVELRPLTGGFSEASVYRAQATDAVGHRQAPSVVKVGPNAVIAKERVAFEHIEEVLGNSAPSVRGFVDLGDRAGIKYSFASMGQGSVRTLQDLILADTDTATIERLLREALEGVLAPLYAAATLERLSLLGYYGFSTRWADGVADQVAALGHDPAAATLHFADGSRLPNPCRFYDTVLTDCPRGDGEYRYVSHVHGDLNAANLLVDDHENVWVIDFFHAGRGHVLQDLAKFENDLLFVLTPIEDGDEFAEAMRLSELLRAVTDRSAALPTDVVFRTPALQRAWTLVGVLREIGGRLTRDATDPYELDVARLRYAVHTLGFEEASPWQKQWALATAAGLAADVTAALAGGVRAP